MTEALWVIIILIVLVAAGIGIYFLIRHNHNHSNSNNNNNNNNGNGSTGTTTVPYVTGSTCTFNPAITSTSGVKYGDKITLVANATGGPGYNVVMRAMSSGSTGVSNNLVLYPYSTTTNQSTVFIVMPPTVTTVPTNQMSGSPLNSNEYFTLALATGTGYLGAPTSTGIPVGTQANAYNYRMSANGGSSTICTNQVMYATASGTTVPNTTPTYTLLYGVTTNNQSGEVPVTANNVTSATSTNPIPLVAGTTGTPSSIFFYMVPT